MDLIWRFGDRLAVKDLPETKIWIGRVLSRRDVYNVEKRLYSGKTVKLNGLLW